MVRSGTVAIDEVVGVLSWSVMRYTTTHRHKPFDHDASFHTCCAVSLICKVPARHDRLAHADTARHSSEVSRHLFDMFL
jgi:hypothetical protein